MGDPETDSRLGQELYRVRLVLSLFPGLAILIKVLAYNLLREGIRDALDPRVNR